MSALDAAAIQKFLAGKETAVLATVQADGAPLAMAMWFLHDAAALTMLSQANTQKVRNLRRDPRVAVVVDSGEEYDQLRGVELSGRVEFVGEVPRRGELCAELDTAETLFARKNFGLEEMPHDGRHAWARLTPQKIVSWDFSKLGSV